MLSVADRRRKPQSNNNIMIMSDTTPAELVIPLSSRTVRRLRIEIITGKG